MWVKVEQGTVLHWAWDTVPRAKEGKNQPKKTRGLLGKKKGKIEKGLTETGKHIVFTGRGKLKKQKNKCL